MALPVNVREIMTSGNKIMEERAKPVRIAVWIEIDAPDPLIDALRANLRPETSAGRIRIEVLEPGAVPVPETLTDAVIGVVGGGHLLPGPLQSARYADIPAVAIVWTEASAADWSRQLGHPLRDTLVDDDPVRLAGGRLGEWLTENLASKRLALANNFEFVRHATAVEAVRATAWQNGAIGVAPFLPGADMAIMTANQMKMVLQIAAAFGEPLSAERIKELAVVLGGGFAFRAIAREVVGLIPVLGWAVRGVVGYSGTLAMGYGAIEYFESGGSASGLAERMRGIRERVRAEESAETIDTVPVSVDDVPASLDALPAGEPSGTVG